MDFGTDLCFTMKRGGSERVKNAPEEQEIRILSRIGNPQHLKLPGLEEGGVSISASLLLFEVPCTRQARSSRGPYDFSMLFLAVQMSVLPSWTDVEANLRFLSCLGHRESSLHTIGIGIRCGVNIAPNSHTNA